VAVVSALPTNPSSSNSSSSTNTITKNTMIAIVVIAASVGGAAAIWTLIRKWKLGTSSKFDTRLQPIEWSPEGESGLPGGIREKDIGGAVGAPPATEKRRPNSTGSEGSFHSGDGNFGRNVTGNGNLFAEQDVPPHDFTAGPVQPYPAYEYNAGYVDLQRNNSGGRAPDLQRARSNGGAAAYGNGYEYGSQDQAYAHGHGYEQTEDAYAQDAYGGYEAYGQQPQYQHGQQDAQAAAYNQSRYQGGRY